MEAARLRWLCRPTVPWSTLPWEGWVPQPTVPCMSIPGQQGALHCSWAHTTRCAGTSFCLRGFWCLSFLLFPGTAIPHPKVHFLPSPVGTLSLWLLFPCEGVIAVGLLCDPGCSGTQSGPGPLVTVCLSLLVSAEPVPPGLGLNALSHFPLL